MQGCYKASRHAVLNVRSSSVSHTWTNLQNTTALTWKQESFWPPDTFVPGKQRLDVHLRIYCPCTTSLTQTCFPSLKVTTQVALTVPVSSCSCERSFSALRRLHSWLRQTMGQKRWASAPETQQSDRPFCHSWKQTAFFDASIHQMFTTYCYCSNLCCLLLYRLK